MSGNNNSIVEHYGPIWAAIDSDIKEIVLTVHRGKDPLGQGTLEQIVNWAVGSLRKRYENYQIIIEGSE